MKGVEEGDPHPCEAMAEVAEKATAVKVKSLDLGRKELMCQVGKSKDNDIAQARIYERYCFHVQYEPLKEIVAIMILCKLTVHRRPTLHIALFNQELKEIAIGVFNGEEKDIAQVHWGF